jgi:hypothetical protein
MDPDCCKGTTGSRGCEYRAVPGTQFCPLHTSSAAAKSQEKKELRNYRLNSLLGDRVRELSDSGAVKNSTEEIALLRAILENIANNMSGPNDVLMYSDKIEKLTKEIRGQIETLQKIQERNKELMSRDHVMKLMDQIVGVVAGLITDPDMRRQLADHVEIIVREVTGEK